LEGSGDYLPGTSTNQKKKIKMAKFKCDKCKRNLELAKHSIKVVDGLVVSPEAFCCENYMTSIKEKGKGFGGIIKKPNGTVSGKF